MSCFHRIFCKHPREVGMTYEEHCRFSCCLSWNFFCASIQACIHSIFPCAFQTSSSDYASNINETLNHRNNQTKND